MADPACTLLSPRDSARATLKAEHRTVGRVVHTLREMVKDIAENRCEPDFLADGGDFVLSRRVSGALRPPKEDECLFKYLRKHLRACTEKAKELLDELEAQHVESARLIAAPERAFVLYQGRAPRGLGAFTEAIGQHAQLE